MAVVHGTNNNFEVPSLDLRFADRKDFIDTISGKNLITFSRDSIGTYVDENGIIQTAASGEPRFDHDPVTGESLGLLVEESRTNSAILESFTTFQVTKVSNATIAPDGTFTGTKIVENTVSERHYLSGGNTGNGVARSIYAKAGERRRIYIADSDARNITFDLVSGTIINPPANATASIVDVGNGWYRCSVSSSTFWPICWWGINSDTGVGYETYQGDGVSGVYFWGVQTESGSFPTSYIPTTPTFTSRASTATYYDASGVIQTAASGVARSNAYFPDSSGVMRSAGLLLEAAGTNLLTYSEQFNQWVSSYVSVSSNAVAAPDGTTTADTVVADGSSNAHWIWTSDPTLGPKTFSVFAKAGTGGFLQLLFAGDSNPYANFNLSTGAIGSVGTTSTASIQKLANGWYRCSLYTSSSSATSPYIGLITSATAVRGEANTLSTSVHLWGAQVEQSPYPTSYIPTAGSQVTRAADVSTSSTVTRAADVAQITGSNFSSWYNQNEGTLFQDCISRTPLSGSITQDVGVGIFVRNNSLLQMGFFRYLTNLNVMVYTGSEYSANFNFVSQWPQNVTNKAALAYKVNDFAASTNGSAVQTDTSGTVSAATQLDIGQMSSAVYNRIGAGTFARLTYYPTRLSNALLQKLTK